VCWNVAQGDGGPPNLAHRWHRGVAGDDGNVVLPHLFEEAARAGMRITSVDIQEPNLEAVFLHLTGRALRD